TDTATSYNSLAFNLNAQGKYGEAAPLYEKVLASWRKTLGEEYAETALGYRHLATNLHAQGKYSEAEDAWARASRIYGIVRLRSAPTGLQRASFAVVVSPVAGFSACLARNGKTSLAWQNLESMLARGPLEDIPSGPTFPRPITAIESNRERDLLVTLDQ